MALPKGSAAFDNEPGFCGNCGAILPLLTEDNLVKCEDCKTEHPMSVYGLMESHYVLHFHKPEDYMDKSEKMDDGAAGPVLDRKCRKCGHGKMSYATLQLRSADEGQTVFYTCVKCKFSESENS